MRLSSMKQLDWYRNSSYQSKDIAHVQKTTTQRIADKVCEADQSLCARCTSASNVNTTLPVPLLLVPLLPLRHRC